MGITISKEATVAAVPLIAAAPCSGHRPRWANLVQLTVTDQFRWKRSWLGPWSQLFTT